MRGAAPEVRILRLPSVKLLDSIPGLANGIRHPQWIPALRLEDCGHQHGSVDYVNGNREAEFPVSELMETA
jgi:hypothetical protein